MAILEDYRDSNGKFTKVTPFAPPNHTGKKRSVETKKRMSEAMKGKKRSIEYCKKI